MKKVVAERKDIVFFIKLFPLPMHKDAYDKAKTIVCEKSLSLLEDAFEGKSLPKPKCAGEAVDETIAFVRKLGINGTPTLVLSDGRVLSGYKDAAALKELIGK